MLVAFDCFCLMVSFAKLNDVEFSTFVGVGGWGCLSSLSVVRIGKASLAFRKLAPIFASAAEDMIFLMSWHRVRMATFLVGRVGGLLPFLTSFQ